MTSALIERIRTNLKVDAYYHQNFPTKAATLSLGICGNCYLRTPVQAKDDINGRFER